VLRIRGLVGGVLGVVLFVAAPAASASAIAPQLDPCHTATLRCVNRTISQMQRRQDALASACSHDAPFSLLYLRVTDDYAAKVAGDPAFFSDTAWVNQLDTRFGDYYFKAARDWRAGNHAAVPPAWQIAFDAADNEKVHGLGDVLLGLNAHISNDLPFALEKIGLGPGDHRPDYNKVNDILGEAYSPALAEAAAKFDPTIDDVDTPQLHDFFFGIVELMRANAWWHAQQLLDAPTPAAHAAVVAQIQQSAVDLANAIVFVTRVVNPSERTTRDAYCEAQQH